MSPVQYLRLQVFLSSASHRLCVELKTPEPVGRRAEDTPAEELKEMEYILPHLAPEPHIGMDGPLDPSIHCTSQRISN